MPRGSNGGWMDSNSRSARSASGPQLTFDRDFDFESSNAQFDKDQIEKELKEKLVIGRCCFTNTVCGMQKGTFWFKCCYIN